LVLIQAALSAFSIQRLTGAMDLLLEIRSYYVFMGGASKRFRIGEMVIAWPKKKTIGVFIHGPLMGIKSNFTRESNKLFWIQGCCGRLSDPIWL